jgi:hypothetical protein
MTTETHEVPARERCAFLRPDENHCLDPRKPCGFCPHHCELHHADRIGDFERPDFEPGQELVVYLPWIDEGDRWSFGFWEVDGSPTAAGTGLGTTGLYQWPLDLAGMTARVYRLESEAKHGKTTSIASTFPAEVLRIAGEAGARSSKVCEECGTEGEITNPVRYSQRDRRKLHSKCRRGLRADG